MHNGFEFPISFSLYTFSLSKIWVYFLFLIFNFLNFFVDCLIWASLFGFAHGFFHLSLLVVFFCVLFSCVVLWFGAVSGS